MVGLHECTFLSMGIHRDVLVVQPRSGVMYRSCPIFPSEAMDVWVCGVIIWKLSLYSFCYSPNIWSLMQCLK